MKYIKKYQLFDKVITELNLSNQNLTELPELPDTLEILYCHNNKLTELPELPETLEYLECDHNNLPYDNLKSYWKWYYNKYPSITYEIFDITIYFKMSMLQ